MLTSLCRKFRADVFASNLLPFITVALSFYRHVQERACNHLSQGHILGHLGGSYAPTPQPRTASGKKLEWVSNQYDEMVATIATQCTVMKVGAAGVNSVYSVVFRI